MFNKMDKKSRAFILFVGYKIFPEIKVVALNLKLVHFPEFCLFKKLGGDEHNSPGGHLILLAGTWHFLYVNISISNLKIFSIVYILLFI